MLPLRKGLYERACYADTGDNQSPMSLSSLPSELVSTIVTFVSIVDIFAFARTSARNYAVGKLERNRRLNALLGVFFQRPSHIQQELLLANGLLCGPVLLAYMFDAALDQVRYELPTSGNYLASCTNALDNGVHIVVPRLAADGILAILANDEGYVPLLSAVTGRPMPPDPFESGFISACYELTNGTTQLSLLVTSDSHSSIQALFESYSTFALNYLTGDVVTYTYPWLLLQRRALFNGDRLPLRLARNRADSPAFRALRDTLRSRQFRPSDFTTWQRGFSLLQWPSSSHRCREVFSCPATLRRTTDQGCLRWSLGDAEEMRGRPALPETLEFTWRITTRICREL